MKTTLLLVSCLMFTSKAEKVNVLVIIADDLGIGDVGCYGNNTIRTPAIDSLCRDGLKLTHHLTADTLCTPSRSALMTGRYPQRYGMVGEQGMPPVLMHVASHGGLPHTEATIGDAFTAAGYNTHFTGKWHLGSHCSLFGRNCSGPLSHGFDSTYYLPFTLITECEGSHAFWTLPSDNDTYQALFSTVLAVVLTGAVLSIAGYSSKPFTAAIIFILLPLLWFMFTHYRLHSTFYYRVSPWMYQTMDCIAMNRTEVVEQPLDLPNLNDRLTENSVQFLQSASELGTPFLLFHSFAHVHTPVVTNDRNKGRSKHGKYGDCVEEMDEAIGVLLQALSDLGLSENTLVYFTSDHGGHLESVREDGQVTGGYNGLFKGGKFQGGMEGGVRVPGVMRLPGTIKPGSVLSSPTSLLDVLPTLLELCGLPTLHQLLPHLPSSQVLDGVSIADAVKRPLGGHIRDRVLLHHSGMTVNALRHVTDGHVYKMHQYVPKFDPPGSFRCGWGENAACHCHQGPNYMQNQTASPVLYDLLTDPYEDRPIDTNSTEYQLEVAYLRKYLEQWSRENPYPRSLYSIKENVVLLPWLQPFKKDFNLFHRIF